MWSSYAASTSKKRDKPDYSAACDMRLAHRAERELGVAIIIENLMFQRKAGAKHSLEQNARISSLPLFISNSVSFRVLTIREMCPADRRQWADFLVFLTSPLHRPYKTARTETRWHLLLKTWQMPTQTSASRGYVLFISDVRNTQKSLNCLSVCGHTRGVLKTWKNTDYRRCKKRQGRNSRILLQPISPPASIRNAIARSL